MGPELSQAAVDLDSSADALATTVTAAEVARLMTRLPENATDPFLPLRKRLEATLGFYRYGDAGPSGLLDWAAIQTGLKDPLSRFNRHELEQWFSKFRIDLDEHLKKLAREMRRADAKTLDEIIAKATGGAKQALRRVDLGR